MRKGRLHICKRPAEVHLLSGQMVKLCCGDVCISPGVQAQTVLLCMQVLLSQVHRLRALVLLGRFLDMGRWAVDLALSVGIFPYVLKLLQTTAPDLRQTLVFIWTKILALDKTCQVSQLSYLLPQKPCCRPFMLFCEFASSCLLIRMSLMVTDGHLLHFW